MTGRKRSEGTPPDGTGGSVSDLSTDSNRLILIKIGELSANVEHLSKSIDQLSTRIEGQGEKVDQLRIKAEKAQTAVIVGGSVMMVAFGLFWWAFGQHVESMVQNALREVVMRQPPPIVEQQ